MRLILLYRVPTSEVDGERRYWLWGEWGEAYVRRAVAGWRRWCEGVEVTCVTDEPRVGGIVGVRVVPLVGRGRGWWSKVEVFRSEVSEGVCVYSDLDNVVCGDVSALWGVAPRPLVMCDDVVMPGVAMGGLMVFDAGSLVMRGLWEEWLAGPAVVEREFSGAWPGCSDQAFIADRVRRSGYDIPLLQDVTPRGMVVSSRGEVERGADVGGCGIVVGNWEPKPHQSRHAVYREHWRE